MKPEGCYLVNEMEINVSLILCYLTQWIFYRYRDKQ